MGKHIKNRKMKFLYNVDRKKLWKKSKKLPAIKCPEIKQAWDNKKTVFQNMADMGLSADPNKTLKIANTKELIGPKSMKVEDNDKTRKSLKPRKGYVAQALEDQAGLSPAKTLRLSEPDVQYCIYMMEKYGDDYKAMAKDPKNYYQDTPKQIRRKINIFTSIPEQYNDYLQSKVFSSKLVNTTEMRTPSSRGTVLDEMRSRSRRSTRWYEAARRNGHYVTPTRGNEKCQSRASLSSVKRKLHFGRKPPRSRGGEHLEDEGFHSEMENDTPCSSKCQPLFPIETESAPNKSSQKSSSKAHHSLVHELNCLIEDSD
ncbi:hypothetical protein CHS0354_006125 [Potamilus streckersoni]|uniref:Nucleolar protein 16 n=1 Tax=Potamilus streckersoni TaxID=2493646 RepID=A0AAE0W284_9BIVA|nr:hypothetical protein CHS0354_006125 [Potamilus streckersoni]